MALDETIGLLRDVPLIGRLEPDALRLLAFSAETRKLRPGAMLFRKGERSDGGYVILSGEIEMVSAATERAAQAGIEAEPDAILGPGALIGQLALFVRMKRPAAARARTTCELLRISPTLLRRVLAEFPAAAAGMHDDMAADLEDLTQGLEKVGAALLRPPGRPERG